MTCPIPTPFALLFLVLPHPLHLKMGKLRQNIHCCVHPHPKKGWDYPPDTGRIGLTPHRSHGFSDAGLAPDVEQCSNGREFLIYGDSLRMSRALHASITTGCRVSGCWEVFLSMFWLGGGWAVPHPGDLAPPRSHIDPPLAFSVLGATGNTSLMAFPTPGMLVSLALLLFLIFVSLGHQILWYWDTFCPRSAPQPTADKHQWPNPCRRAIFEATLCRYISGFLIFYKRGPSPLMA